MATTTSAPDGLAADRTEAQASRKTARLTGSAPNHQHVQPAWLLSVWLLRVGMVLSACAGLGIGAALLLGVVLRGEQVIFVTYEVRNGEIDAEIMIADIHHRLIYNLTNAASLDVNPVWSPDGEKVAFVSNRVGASQIYVIDADGGNLRRLSVDDARNHNNPLWSADGTLIFFTQGNPGNQALYSVRVDGSDLQLLNREQAQQIALLLDISQTASRTRILSPNGTSTMFIAFRDRTWGIYSGEDAENAQLLASLGETYSELPVWSADGVWVAFIANHKGQRDVYVMHGDGSNLRRMTYTRAFDGQVRWRP